MSHQISAGSVEYVRVMVSARESGAAVNPTSATVTMAFLTASTEPVSGDWKTASWETDASSDPDIYYARCLIGSAVVLAAGTYNTWVKIASSPETVIKRSGYLEVV